MHHCNAMNPVVRRGGISFFGVVKMCMIILEEKLFEKFRPFIRSKYCSVFLAVAKLG